MWSSPSGLRQRTSKYNSGVNRRIFKCSELHMEYEWEHLSVIPCVSLHGERIRSIRRSHLKLGLVGRDTNTAM